MTFPYDFGFVPSTLADDGDPVDVLVLMDEPAFPGCLLKCRIVGIIQGHRRTASVKARRQTTSDSTIETALTFLFLFVLVDQSCAGRENGWKSEKEPSDRRTKLLSYETC